MDDVILNKIATIERCLKRIREEYIGHEDALEHDYTRQDSIILNLQRACETSIDIGMRVVRIRRLGVPQDSREVFSFLENEGVLPSELSQDLQKMVGFRNIAIHQYQQINLAVVRSVLDKHLISFEQLIKIMKDFI